MRGDVMARVNLHPYEKWRRDNRWVSIVPTLGGKTKACFACAEVGVRHRSFVCKFAGEEIAPGSGDVLTVGNGEGGCARYRQPQGNS